MSIRHAILGLLAAGPMHGYGLKAAYEDSVVPGSSLNIGQVYPALDKLAADGHVTVEAVAQAERPTRNVYTITASGRAELEAWLGALAPPEGVERNETFLRLVLAWRLQQQGFRNADPLAVLAAERRACLGRLRTLAEQRERAEGLPAQMLFDLAIGRLNAMHLWLDGCEDLIRREGGGR